MDHGQVAVDHRIHQRVQHEAAAVRQQVRLALAACAHVLEALARLVADRQQEIAANEQVDLADVDAVLAVRLQRLHHQKQGGAELLQLWTLVAVQRVFHRQRV
ncbi:hypothetical protein D3C78_1599220 [compost metagenome]